MLGWRNFERKQRKGKEIGRKGRSFPYLDVGRNGKGKKKQCRIVNWIHQNNAKNLPRQLVRKSVPKGGLIDFPILPVRFVHYCCIPSSAPACCTLSQTRRLQLLKEWCQQRWWCQVRSDKNPLCLKWHLQGGKKATRETGK